MRNMLCIQYLQIYRRVVMASEQVLVASRRVLMSRLPVPVASREVLMRYEFAGLKVFLLELTVTLAAGHS